jgi:hypothetical protein
MGEEKAAGAFEVARQLAFRMLYFSEVLTLVKVPLSLVPTPLTAAMIASAMPVAISPYSMAVAPDSSARNLRTMIMSKDTRWRNTPLMTAPTMRFKSKKPG